MSRMVKQRGPEGPVFWERRGTMRVNMGAVALLPPGEGRRMIAGKRPLAVFRERGGGVFATQATCPHRAAPLAEGSLGGTTVVCPMHGYRFDIVTGESIGGGGVCGSLRTYPTHVDEAGDLMIEVPDDCAAE